MSLGTGSKSRTWCTVVVFFRGLKSGDGSENVNMGSSGGFGWCRAIAFSSEYGRLLFWSTDLFERALQFPKSMFCIHFGFAIWRSSKSGDKSTERQWAVVLGGSSGAATSGPHGNALWWTLASDFCDGDW